MVNTINEDRAVQGRTDHPDHRQSDVSSHDLSTRHAERETTRIQWPEPGELAIVVKDDSDQLNLGLIVRVLDDLGFSGWFQWNAKTKRWGPCCYLKTSYVEAISTRGLSYHSGDCDGDLVVRRVGTIPTSYLCRIV